MTRTELENVNQLQNVFLIQLHARLQKTIIFFCAPVVMFAFGFWYYFHPAWQSKTLFVTSIGMSIAWGFGYRLVKKGRAAAAVSTFVLPVVIQAGLVILLLKGVSVSALWSSLGATIYAGLFSRKQLYLTAFVTIFFSALGEMIHLQNFYLRQDTAGQAVIPALAIDLMVGCITVYFLRRSQLVNERLFGGLQQKNESQTRIIETFYRVEPAIRNGVEQITSIASSIASQAAEQAAAIEEVSRTTDIVQNIAVKTAASAVQALTISKQSRERSLESSNLHRSIEKQFESVAGSVSNSAKDVTLLADKLENIEEILAFNRQIGTNLQVLAINASIEADGAGDFGKGFGAVVAEFKDMIHNTEENLNKSSTLLSGIRDQSRETADAIMESSRQLLHYLGSLSQTGKTIDENAKNHLETAEFVTGITDSAKEQQVSVTQVGIAIGELSSAAVELESSSSLLLSSLEQIVESQRQLENILKNAENGDDFMESVQ